MEPEEEEGGAVVVAGSMESRRNASIVLIESIDVLVGDKFRSALKIVTFLLLVFTLPYILRATRHCYVFVCIRVALQIFWFKNCGYCLNCPDLLLPILECPDWRRLKKLCEREDELAGRYPSQHLS